VIALLYGIAIFIVVIHAGVENGEKEFNISPATYGCLPTTLAYYQAWNAFAALSLIGIVIAILRTLHQSWRILVYVQWRSALFLIHYIVVFSWIVVYFDFIYPHFFRFEDLPIFPDCVSSHPREEYPPCTQHTIGYYPSTIAYVVLGTTWPGLACLYVYFSNPFTWFWWKILFKERRIVRNYKDYSDYSRQSTRSSIASRVSRVNPK
jgi:hypothetical protein